MMFEFVTRGETVAEIYSAKGAADLERGKLVKLNGMNSETGPIFNIVDAEDNASHIAVVVRVNPYDKKEGTVMDFKMNVGILFKTDNYDAAEISSWNVGDLVGVKGGKFSKVDGTTITNPVARVVNIATDHVVLQAI